MKKKGVEVGDKVYYHSVINGPATSKDHVVIKVLKKPNNFGQDVAWISGKAGCVSMKALTRMEG